VLRVRLFVESDIDAFMALNTEFLRCEVFGSIWNLQANQGQAMLSLCISDAAKGMLLANSSFIPHLVRTEL
jgi:hypothetical protein